MEREMTIRFATREDAATVLEFIGKLAEYEKRLPEFTARVEDVERRVFDEKMAEVLLAEKDGKTVGYVLFHGIYSTFGGDAGMYLDDLFLLPELRGRGCGKAFMRFLTRLAVERDYHWMEWDCLTWNPSKLFYEQLGAEPVTKYIHYSLSAENIRKCAEEE